MWHEGQCATHMFNIAQYSITLNGTIAKFKTATLIKALLYLRLLESRRIPITLGLMAASISVSAKIFELQEVTRDIEGHFYLEIDLNRQVSPEELGHAEKLLLAHMCEVDESDDFERWSELLKTEDIAWLCIQAMTVMDVPSLTTAAVSALAAYKDACRHFECTADVVQGHGVYWEGSSTLIGQLQTLARSLVQARLTGR